MAPDQSRELCGRDRIRTLLSTHNHTERRVIKFNETLKHPTSRPKPLKLVFIYCFDAIWETQTSSYFQNIWSFLVEHGDCFKMEANRSAPVFPLYSMFVVFCLLLNTSPFKKKKMLYIWRHLHARLTSAAVLDRSLSVNMQMKSLKKGPLEAESNKVSWWGWKRY